MTESQAQWFVLDVNPYPWKVPPFSAGRKGNRMFVSAGRDEGLHSYKQAIKEQLEAKVTWKIEGPVALYLWFYRNIPEYTTAQGRRARKHEADNTNLQKATEDALQEYLYENDKDVAYNVSYRVEQSADAQGMVVVCVVPWDMPQPVFPDAVQFEIDELKNRYPLVNPQDSTGGSPF